jgi:site-specific DNA-cytosine methylase
MVDELRKLIAHLGAGFIIALTSEPFGGRNSIAAQRLQGFPDGWTGGTSDTQKYECLGNAVTVNVIAAIVPKLV